MNLTKLLRPALLAVASFTFAATGLRAANVTAALGDVVLSFRASGGQGQSINLEVDLGPASQFYSPSGSSFAVTGLSVQDLIDTYGSNWSTRTDLSWGIAGTTGSVAGTDDSHAVSKTLWGTRREETPGTQSTAWNRASTFTQQGPANTLATMVNVGATGTLNNAPATANSATSAAIDATLPGSYSQQLGSSAAAFGFFNPAIDLENTTNIAAGAVAVSDFYELQPGTGAGTYLGSFGLASDGTLTFATSASYFAAAENLTPALGDLVLGFRATGGQGQSTNLEIDLGPASQFYNASGSSFSLSGLAVQDLIDLYGADWATRTDLFWGVIGTTGSVAGTDDGHAVSKTLWATRAEDTAGTQSTPWNRASTFTLQGPANTVATMVNAGATGSLSGAATTANSSSAAAIDATLPGSYTQQLGSSAAAFGYFNPSVAFENGVNAPVGGFLASDLYEVQPGTGEATYLGTFGINPAGAITFATSPDMFASTPPAPVINSALTASGQVGVAFNYSITATNTPASYDATGLPDGLSVDTSTGVISGTPTAQGTSNVTISATNDGGTGSATLVLTIDPAAASAPVINSTLTAGGQVGVAFTYTITATNTPTSFDATGLPDGLAVDTSTGVISGTPTTAGASNVTVSATNGAGTGSATLVVTIDVAPPPAPVISSALTASGQVGIAFNYAIAASNSPASFNATGLPDGLSVDTSTGVISGTPSAEGASNVTISATNAGGTGSATLVVTINPAPTPIASDLGDMVLGFRAATGTGQAVNLEVDLGPASQFYNPASSTFTVTGLSATDLATIYGSDWNNRTDLFWGVVGTTGSVSGTGDQHAVAKTMWATRAEALPGTKSRPWNRGSTFAQQGPANTIATMVVSGSQGTLKGALSTGNSATAAAIDATVPGSYSYQLGTNAAAFGFFNPSVAFENGVDVPSGGYVVSDLYEVQPGTGESTYLGSFGLARDGTLKFSTDPATFAGPLSTAYFCGMSDDGKMGFCLIRHDRTHGTVFIYMADTGVYVANQDVTINDDGSFDVDLSTTASAQSVHALAGSTTLHGVINGGVVDVSVTGDTNLTFSVDEQVGSSAAGVYQLVFGGDVDGTAFVVVDPAGTAHAFFNAGSFTDFGQGTSTGSGQWQVTTAGGRDVALSTTGSGGFQATVDDPVSGDSYTLGGLPESTAVVHYLVNLSGRSYVNGNANPVILGFVVTGSQPAKVLIRGVGPALLDFSVGSPVADPHLDVYDNNHQVIASNDDWEDNGAAADITDAETATGAFHFKAGNKDSALVMDLAPGVYTAVLTAQTGDDHGVALAEVYDADPDLSAPSRVQRLVNSSTRGWVDDGDRAIIAGFVVNGNFPKRMVIRGIGPGLTDLGVADALATGQLELYRTENNTSTSIAINDRWWDVSDVDRVKAAFAQVFAFPLGDTSEDSALVLTLDPGLYTAVYRPRNGAAGNGLVEVYEADLGN